LERQRLASEKQEKEIQDKKAAKSRGNQALIKERQQAVEQASQLEEIRQIERKKLVISQESYIAHEIAQKYQKEQIEKSEKSSVQPTFDSSIS
jgi:hypothetical protein